MLASAPPDHYRRALDAILRDAQIDSVITIFIPPLVTDPATVGAAVADAARSAGPKPVLGVFMRAEGAPATLGQIPCYAFPESAALALSRVATYAEWRTKTPDSRRPLGRFDRDRIRSIVDATLGRGGGWVEAADVQTLLVAAGIDVPAARVANDVNDAVTAAHAMGYPVALKGLGPHLLHKTERRAVCLDLETEDELRAAYDGLRDRLGDDLTGVLVQEMVPKGVEMIVGAIHDPSFGPVVACGTGGALVDVIADTAFRLHPLTPTDAREMIAGLRGERLLRGYRGSPPADRAALEDVLLRVSELLDAAPEIQELDLNPVIVLSSGARVADARIRIAVEPPVPRGRRVDY
jgi:acyl-CoA synthetase (NDP forming)